MGTKFKTHLKSFFGYLYEKKIFGLFITGFAVTAILSWFYLTSAIQKNINYRLENELNIITSAVTSNIHIYENTLGYVHAYFRTEGVPNRNTFRRLSESIEVQQINHGIQGLGYISIVKKNQLSTFIAQHKDHPFFRTDNLAKGREIYAPLTMVEPLTGLRIKRLGTDLLLEESRREAIFSAIRSSGITLSKPLNSVYVESDMQPAMILLLPFYKSNETPATPDERLAQIQGLIYIPMRMNTFFESILGKPDQQKERVNFRMSLVDEKDQTESALYTRFNTAADDKAMVRTRILNVFGQKWKLTITTFPQFFNFGDLYLANTVSFSFILCIGLLFSVFRQARNLLVHEKKTKELMEMTIAQGRQQTAKLRSLNEMNSATHLDMDMNHIIHDFFNASLPLSQSTHAFLFCSLNLDDPETISFCEAKGFRPGEIENQNRSLTQLNELTTNSFILKKEANSANVFSQFITAPDHFSDWVLIAIPSREFRRCGILFLGRENLEAFSDIDIEIIESMVFQLGARIDNSRLFKKVEDANKIKTAFLSNMNHEIRTPLNAITGFSEILEQTRSQKEKHALIEGIKKNATQLTSIIDNILDISKIEFGRIFIQKKITSVSSLIKSIEPTLESKAKAKNLKFNIESQGLLPAWVETDESRVKQILNNLIGNAIKFTEKGSVTLQLECDTSNPLNPNLLFNIHDTGIGISPQSQIELFQSFTQIDVSNTRRFGGVGLGLALSRRLAQQFGGDVTLVQSRLNEGSTFQLKIPCGELVAVKWIARIFDDITETQKQEKRDEPIQKISPVDLKNKRALIVEDSEDNQEIFKFFLNSAGAISEVIDNGEDAVKKASVASYDFILMDIQLPKMDGLEATRRIRSSGFSNPIIALTAHASAEERISCLNAGCVDIITKPVTQMTLIKRIKTLIEEPL